MQQKPHNKEKINIVRCKLHIKTVKQQNMQLQLARVNCIKQAQSDQENTSEMS